MSRPILATLSLIVAASLPARASGDGALEFAVLGAGAPARLDLALDIEGSRLDAVWDETFARLFAFFDGDGNGAIDEQEAKRLPSPLSLRQAMGNGFTPPVGKPPAFAEIDRDGDGKVVPAELAAFYRGKGIGSPVVGAGRMPAGDELAGALLKQLDPDGDGKVAEGDWNAAIKDLGKLDANDDELIGAGELVADLVYPGAAGTALMKPPGAGAPLPGPLGDLPLILLPADPEDRRWAEEIARRSPGAEIGAPAEWRGHAADGRWLARLDEVPDGAQFALATDRVRVAGWVAGGRLGEAVSASRGMIAELSERPPSEAGGAGKGRRRSGGGLAWLAPIADRNGDGKLDPQEVEGWLDLQAQIARGQVLVTILDGGGLFEILDASRDGALSMRELRSSWRRLEESGCVADGIFDRARLPRVVLVAISRGYPESLAPGRQPGPAWSRAMDRNGDGDVSRREFTGTPAQFDKLDRDGDGLIDAGEAAPGEGPPK